MAAYPRIVVELFRDKYYQGAGTTIIEPVTDLALVGMTEMVSSMRVYHGPSSAASPNQRAMFFEEPDYRGRRIVLPPGYYPDIHAIPYNFGDLIRSLNFSPSAPLTAPQYGWIPVVAEVFEDVNYQGRRATILRDINYFGQIGLNDSISSLRVTRGPNFPFTGSRVIFYQHPDYEGRQLVIDLGSRDFSVQIPNLHDSDMHFGDVISSAKILPTGRFSVLVVESDARTREPELLADCEEHQENRFDFTHLRINANLDNHGDANAHPFSSVAQELDRYDIIWFTWNAAGHDRDYFLTPSDERAIRDWVARGGVLWASATDENIIAEGEEQGGWKGDWLPVDRHPARVVNSADVKVWMTREGRQTGLFTWPSKIDTDAIITDDHWVTTDPTYVILARRDDNQEPVAARLPWGDGAYVLFAIDTRSEDAAQAARPVIGNALSYLAGLAWASSPRQPLRGRNRMVG